MSSTPTQRTAEWLIAANGDLINLRFVVRLYEDKGKLKADMDGGAAIEIAGGPVTMAEMRRQLPINNMGPAAT